MKSPPAVLVVERMFFPREKAICSLGIFVIQLKIVDPLWVSNARTRRVVDTERVDKCDGDNMWLAYGRIVIFDYCMFN